jgi:hypothetical protein
MKTLALLGALLAIAACTSGKLSNDPRTASGDTPVRYVICGLGDSQCFVSARFSDFSACESHKQWSEMLCEKSEGNMICNADTNPVAKSYCTQ